MTFNSIEPTKDTKSVNPTPPTNPDFHFGTKGETLARLGPILELARVCEQIILPVSKWQGDPGTLACDIVARFAPAPLAVRSSSGNEDTWQGSNAGAFESLTGVEPTPGAIAEAVDRVIGSYGPEANGQQVLIQPMVADVALSGVVLTRDLDTGGPYYVINYDDFSGRTDTVTGGAISKTVAVHRTNPGALHSPRMRKLIDAVMEVERATGCQELDIEFCVTEGVEVYILQVRPLAARRAWHAVPDDVIDAAIADIRRRLQARMTPSAGLAGATTILGEMPDWNPAEMIGNTPRPLALSLYKLLITDQVWADARTEMGYRPVPHPLLIDYAGRPYIDVRLSLNSFLPKNLEEGLAHRLVNHQLALLAENKLFHDKIEFHVATTCTDLSMDSRMAELRKVGFATDEIASFADGLHAITSAAMRSGVNGLQTHLACTERFLVQQRRDSIAPRQNAQVILAAVRSHGTLPFSILARHGFIGVTLLRSAVDIGILDERDADLFMRGVHTVATDLAQDMNQVTDGRLERVTFLEKYGHLRPGTYDILSWRYDEKPDLYLGARPKGRSIDMVSPTPFLPTQPQCKDLVKALKAQGLPDSASAFFDYIAMAIRAREQAKFAFTRGISDALKELEAWGETVGVSREDISYLPIETINAYAGDQAALTEAIARGRESHKLTRAIRLPHLIVEPDDIDIVRAVEGQPTFITTKSATARKIFLRRNETQPLDGQIILIESADPGFDWIFSHRIIGLVTKYGGANSHMAIRCAEFGLPAAIGCGDKIFEDLSTSSVIDLDCAARRVTGH